MKPRRIQRQRTKGWKMPADTINCTRPGKWGNPAYVGGRFIIGDPNPAKAGAFRMVWCSVAESVEHPRAERIMDVAHAVDWFRRYLHSAKPDLSTLRGKNLACWCKVGAPCHADILLEEANK